MPASAKFEPAFETLGDPRLERMLSAARTFVDDFDTGKKPRWLVMLGTSGAGKTHLAREIWRWFKASPHFATRVSDDEEIIYPGQFASWRNVADGILSGNYARMNELCREKFVVLDDIGAEYQDRAGIVKSKLDRLIDARLGKWTLITCNHTLQQIAERMDTRIASRMIRGGSVVVEVDVPDFNARARG